MPNIGTKRSGSINPLSPGSYSQRSVIVDRGIHTAIDDGDLLLAVVR